MGERYILIIILCCIGSVLQGLFILSEFRRRMLAAVFLKGSASLIFVTVGLVSLSGTGTTSLLQLILYGLALGALGDILLNVRYLAGSRESFFFVTGVASFFFGHILYLAALITVSDRLIPALAAAVLITAVILCIMQRVIIASVPMKILGGVYVAAVVLMACTAVGNAVRIPNTGRIMFAAGAVLFLVSDLILIFNTFGRARRMCWSAVCLSLYYPGQLLIALALGFGL